MSDYIIHNGELYHYGVKGMKWGVRKDYDSDGNLTKRGKRRIKYRMNAIAQLTYPPRLKYPYKDRARVIEDMNRPEKRGDMERAWAKAYKAKPGSKAMDKYERAAKEWLDEYQTEMAGATLRDINVEDTQAGREYVRQLLYPEKRD